MPISELGYRHWEGERVSPLWRWLAITRTHVGIAYRSSRLLRRFLIFAWAPLFYFAPVFFAVGYLADPDNDLSEGGFLTEIGTEVLPAGLLEELRANPEAVLPAVWAVAFYFFFTILQSILAMIIVAIVGPPLISRDVRNKSFLLYLSKPIGAWEYLLGKLGTVLFFVLAITLAPALVLYVIGIALSPDLGTLVATAPVLLRIVVAALMISLPASMIVLLLSSLTRDHRIATFGWAALCILGEIAYGVISFRGGQLDIPAASWAYLASLREVSTTATAGVLNLEGYMAELIDVMRAADVPVDTMLEQFSRGDNVVNPAFANAIGIDSGVEAPGPAAIGFLLGVIVICALAIRRRIMKPLRI